MPIKKSFLEHNVFYRLIKVFTIIFPFLAFAIVYSKGYVTENNLSENNIIFAVIAIIAYIIIVSVGWGIFSYIVFGGVEDDTKKPVIAAQPALAAADQAALKQAAANQAAGPLVAFLVIIIFIVIIFALSDGTGFDLEHTYGTACTAGGKTGIYGTNANCITCSAGSNAVTDAVGNCSKNAVAGVYCCSSSGSNDGNGGNGGTHAYGTACSAGGKNGLYGTNGSCLTCSSTQKAVTDPSGSGGCSNGVAGVYCCSQCIPTGCGRDWHCVGSYYVGNQHLDFNGCLPVRAGEIYSSWSGTCRQCP